MSIGENTRKQHKTLFVCVFYTGTFALLQLEETEKMLYAQELHSRVCSVSLDEFDECNLHPHIVVLRERLKHLIVRQHELKKCVAARPDPPLFDSLAKVNTELKIL
jgi:hypothetical protein